jgi:hypothetical protein
MTKFRSIVIFWPVLVGDAAITDPPIASRCESTKSYPILCGVIGDNVAGRFDSLVFDYFKANFLGYEYLRELSSLQPILKHLERDIKGGLHAVANKILWKYPEFFTKKTTDLSYGLHRALGAIEFVAKLKQAKAIPAILGIPEGPSTPLNTKLLSLDVLSAAKSPAIRESRHKMKGLIGKVKSVEDESLKKLLLQIIARSGWTGEMNTKVVDKMVWFIGKNPAATADVAKLGRIVFSIDALLARTEFDWKSLGDDIGDILTLEDEIVVLDREIFGANVDERTKAQRFDALVKSYYVANKFDTGYLGHLTRLCNGISGITDDDKTGIMEIVVKILDAPVSDTPRLDIHLALATIEYFAKFGRLPKSEWYLGGNSKVSDMLEKLAQVPIASYKSIFFELIGICAWDAKSQANCLMRMADFLNFPQWLFVVDDSAIPVVLAQLEDADLLWLPNTPHTHFLDMSSLCHSCERGSQKLDCLKQMEAFAIHSVIRLRGNIEKSFDRPMANPDIVHEIELVESGLKEIQKSKNHKALHKHGK